MRETTTVNEVVDEIVSVVKSVDTKSLSLDDMSTILGSFYYFTTSCTTHDDINVQAVIKLHSQLKNEMAFYIQQLSTNHLLHHLPTYNNTDELLTAIRRLCETSEVT